MATEWWSAGSLLLPVSASPPMHPIYVCAVGGGAAPTPGLRQGHPSMGRSVGARCSRQPLPRGGTQTVDISGACSHFSYCLEVHSSQPTACMWRSYLGSLLCRVQTSNAICYASCSLQFAHLNCASVRVAERSSCAVCCVGFTTQFLCAGCSAATRSRCRTCGRWRPAIRTSSTCQHLRESRRDSRPS